MKEKATLLFVDDEERIVRSLKMLFMTKYNVKTTTDGNEALEIIRREKVHVLISDQRMPLMTGVELLKQAREIAPSTMRLLLTGYSDLAAIVGSVNEGEIFRYINKPWVAEDIKSTVDKAADIALNLDNLNAGESKPAQSLEKTNISALHFLILDDDASSVAMIKELIGSHHIIEVAKSLDGAFDVLSKKPIAIVVAEVRLEGEDITDSIKTLKQHNPDILTIVLTSFQDTKTLISLINQGQVYRFLPKPIQRNLLAKSIEATARHYLTLKSRPQLLARHHVEKANEERPLSTKVIDFINKIRNRSPSSNRLGV